MVINVAGRCSAHGAWFEPTGKRVNRAGRHISQAQTAGSRGDVSGAGEALKKHGFKEQTEASVTNKLARGAFPATWFLACLAALELDGIALEEI
jgi:hypothetical protein